MVQLLRAGQIPREWEWISRPEFEFAERRFSVVLRDYATEAAILGALLVEEEAIYRVADKPHRRSFR